VIPGYHLDEPWLAGAMSTRLSLLAHCDTPGFALKAIATRR
jgi:hypothetical protein